MLKPDAVISCSFAVFLLDSMFAIGFARHKDPSADVERMKRFLAPFSVGLYVCVRAWIDANTKMQVESGTHSYRAEGGITVQPDCMQR